MLLGVHLNTGGLEMTGIIYLPGTFQPFSWSLRIPNGGQKTLRASGATQG
jgi:hypothetical protein